MAKGKYVVVSHSEEGIIVPAFLAWGSFFTWMEASNEAVKRQGQGFDAEIIELNKQTWEEKNGEAQP